MFRQAEGSNTRHVELLPPGCHRRNIAEVAIKGFKQHFLGVLAGLPDDFPWSLWDRLLPQTKITLNLLRQSNATPTVSAYAHVYGNFYYNRMPLAPMGCPCHVHVKPDNRNTWAFHTLKGFYLFTLGDHYRTHNMYITTTRDEQLSDTVNFMHRSITRPVITHADRVINAMAQFVKRINEMTGKNTALTKKNGVNMKQLQALANAAASITAAHPEIAQQISPPVLSANQNPNMQLNPPIEHLRRSPIEQHPIQSSSY